VDKRLVRLLYIFEFPIALMAVFTLWSQVAGQGHLDMMAWWWKLGLGAGTAFAAVKFTAAAVEAEDPWHTRSVKWFLLMLALLAGCAAVTYYYHVNEPPEEDQEEDTQPTITGVLAPRRAYDLAPASGRLSDTMPSSSISEFTAVRCGLRSTHR
jgi:hypothetical protein